MTHQTDAQSGEPQADYSRPDLVLAARTRLGRIERFNLWLVRRSFQPGPFDQLMRLLQRTIGAAWIIFATRHLRVVVGLDRIKDLRNQESLILVANHRSFFDLYLVTSELIRRGMRKRIIFLVRSNFFYDSLLGTLVNFLMSFLSMYPPVFRDRKKAGMNVLALGELSYLIRQGGFFCGLHPEGTRKRDEDPYTFLPAQPGVGRVIYETRASVVPVFINGLSNDLGRQVRGNFTGRGDKIYMVFGSPVDFSDLFDKKSSPATYREISERCMEHVGKLGLEEKQLRTCDPEKTR